MLVSWLYIDATREGELTVCYRGGWSLVVFERVAELVYGSRLVAIVPVGRA